MEAMQGGKFEVAVVKYGESLWDFWMVKNMIENKIQWVTCVFSS